MDEVEHSQNYAPQAATEMNVGLHSAGSGHLARHDRPDQGSMHLRTAINPLYRTSIGLKPSAMRGETRLRGGDVARAG